MGMSLSLVQLSLLDQVRGFVAVGRRMSITLASQDLCLTQSAVSRQIHALEEQLGVKLLVRGYRSIAFTPEGERLFRSADGAIQQLQDAMGDIRTTVAARPVTVSASIGVTGLWLLHRLHRFQKLHPAVDIRVAANNRVGDLRNDGIDLAIRYTSPALAPEGAIRLFDESIAPVAHPSLGLRPYQDIQMPLKSSLLEFDEQHHPWLHWREWLSPVEWAAAKPKGIIRFNQYDQVIQAALAGQGIALGRVELIQPLLDEGKLVMIAPPKQASHAYWLVKADERSRADVKKVADWIEHEASETHNWKSPA
jgi:LysR family glycine cleavage system transcriptional activator